MKKIYIVTIFSCLLLSCTGTVFGQMVGDNVFLQGRYVEIGIAPNGGYGSTVPAPTGFHPNIPGTAYTFYDPALSTSTPGGSYLGFVADYGADGWTVGSPGFFGDFYLPGTPQEGWAISVGGVESDAYIPSYEFTGATGFTGGLSGTNISYSNSGGIMKGVWSGSDGALKIRQTTTLDTSKLYFTVNVILTNTGTTPLTDIYYIRTVDPDNDETVSSDYTTINTIAFQLPNPTNKVLVSTTGDHFTNAYLGLGTKDCRAKCMIFDGGLAPEYLLSNMWSETTSYFYTDGFTYTDDVGIALEFNIGTLAAGDSTSLTYAYILNASYIDSALNSTRPSYLVNNAAHDSTDTINLCTYPNDSVLVAITQGGFYHWSWAPDSFITDTTGISNVIHTDSITGTITYTITGTNSAGGCDSVKYYLTLEHGSFPGPIVPSTTYCQFAPSVPLTSPGTGVTWWTSPTGGVGSPTAPTPSTDVAGTTVYYISQAVGLCQSTRSPDTVIVVPLPLPPTLYGTNPYCQGQPFVPFTATGTGVLWYTANTGGIGNATAPTVNTEIPGVYTFYASQTVNGCEGPRQPIATTVLDSIIPQFTYVIHYGCNGDTVFFSNSSIGATHYVWHFGDGNTDTAVNPVHVYHSQNTFNITLFGTNGGCIDSSNQAIPLVHPLSSSFTPSPDLICQGDSITFTNNSVGTGATYTWIFGDGITNTNANPVHIFTNSGTYSVQLITTDFIPCSDTSTVVVYVDSLSGISLSLTDSVLCSGTYVTMSGVYASLGNTGVTWDFGNGDSIKNVNPVVYAYNNATGPQTITVTAHYRVCPDPSTSRVITIVPQPLLNLGQDTSICPGSEPLILSDNINGGAPGATWLWSTGQTTPSIAVVAPGTYYATVNINNCYTSDTVLVKNDCYMDIPNVFTPNGDGTNDYFFPRQYLTKGLTSFSMNIYNRWGQLVFQTTTLDGRGWDGKFNNTDQPEGVFVYIIDATFKDGQKEHHQGNVTLLR